jgi:hypothetical protein
LSCCCNSRALSENGKNMVCLLLSLVHFIR